MNPPNQDKLQPSSGLGGRELYTKEQWEARKSVIKQLYNLENKPFKRVIEILQAEHNFFPTRRQFYRKISEWGLEKNIKDKEMRSIIQNLSQRKDEGGNLAPEFRGQVIDPMKIERWQRRHGGRKSVASLISGSPYDANSSGRTSKSAHALEASVESSEWSTFDPPAETPAQFSAISDSKIQDFSHWSYVDVPGSPLLTRLFEALKIECDGTIPSLDLLSSSINLAPLPTPEAELIANTSQDPSDDEHLSFSTGSGSMDLLRYSHEVLQESEGLPLESNPNRDELSFSEWTYREWDFARGQPLKVNTSCLFGLSPFPVSSKSTQHQTLSYGKSGLYARARNFQAEEIECKSKLRTLTRRLGLDDPRTLVAMYDLANLYVAQFKYRNAERLYRQRAIYCQKVLGLNGVSTLAAYLDVVQILSQQGETLKAHKIHCRVHEKIIELVSQDHTLALRSNSYRSTLLLAFGSFEEAEKLSRQTFQVRMHTLGPRHKRTLFYMQNFGLTLRHSGKLVESESLLRISSEFYLEAEGPSSNGTCESLRCLADVLYKQGRYEEGRALSQKIAENSSALLGHDHPETLYSLWIVTACMWKQGNISESELQLRKILKLQIKKFGEMNLDACYTMGRLSFVLFDTGRYYEAATLREKCYQGFVRFLGTQHCESLWCCAQLADTYEKLSLYEEATSYYEKCISGLSTVYGLSHREVLDKILGLGWCYEQLERNEEALALYQRIFDSMRGKYGDEHPFIAALSGRMMELREAVDVSCEEDDEVQEDSNSTDGFVTEEVPIDGHAKMGETAAEILTPKVADWMGELFDFDLLENRSSDVIDMEVDNLVTGTE